LINKIIEIKNNYRALCDVNANANNTYNLFILLILLILLILTIISANKSHLPIKL